MKVLLIGGTVGDVYESDVALIDLSIGDMVEVTLRDENGMPITVTGEIDEILED